MHRDRININTKEINFLCAKYGKIKNSFHKGSTKRFVIKYCERQAAELYRENVSYLSLLGIFDTTCEFSSDLIFFDNVLNKMSFAIAVRLPSVAKLVHIES